jgi:ADP-ribosyl-[dinitrogen reductase] hydrolase
MGQSPSDKPTPLRNSYWVLPGKVLAGEHPGGTNRDATRQRLQRLIGAGVECFIDLTEPGELKPYDPELPFSVEYLRKPIKDHGTPAQRAHMAEILDCVHDALQSGRCVYIHCRAGIGRTGTVVGCFLVERGLVGEAAVDELNRLWQQNERSHSWPSVPETPDQTKYIVSWKPRGIFDDQGRLTTSNMLSSGAAPDDDSDDAPSPGGAGTPWAHLLSDAPSSAAPNSSRTPPPPARAPGATRPTRTGSSDARSNVPGEGAAGAARSRGSAPGERADWPQSPGGASGGDGVVRSRARGGESSKDATASRANAGLPRGDSGGPIQIPTNAGGPRGTAGASRPSKGAPSRAAIANAARAAASQSDDAGILSDPTSVDRLPQPNTPRPAAATNSQRRPAASGAQGDSAAVNARPSGSRPDAPPAMGRPRPGSAEPSWIGANARAEQSRADVPHGADSSSSQHASPRSSPSGAQADVRAPTGSATGPAALGALPSFDDESDPLLSPEALAAVSNLRDRFIGALIGLAVGDAVAAATQYRRPGSFTPVGDMLGGGPFDLPRGGWSDDTSMALCLADSLLERNGFDARDQVERYRRWQTEGYLSATGQCVGITASSARAIAMAQWRRQAFFGSHDPSQRDPEPLSRVTPAVLFFFATSGEAINQATEAARTTCQAPAVLDACRALASAVYAAISGQPKAVVLAKATLAVAVPTADASGETIAGAPGTSAGDPATSGQGGNAAAPRVGITAPAALASAVQAFAATDNFRDAILYAANLGGDSDVVTAACGQLAGSYYTVKAIPTSWLNGLMQKELILGYADRLLAHAMVGLSG